MTPCPAFEPDPIDPDAWDAPCGPAVEWREPVNPRFRSEHVRFPGGWAAVAVGTAGTALDPVAVTIVPTYTVDVTGMGPGGVIRFKNAGADYAGSEIECRTRLPHELTPHAAAYCRGELPAVVFADMVEERGDQFRAAAQWLRIAGGMAVEPPITGEG